MCGDSLRFNIAGYAAEEREIARVALAARVEAIYTDRRSCAAAHWLNNHNLAVEARRKQRRERARMAEIHSPRGAYRRERKDGPGEILYDKLTAESSAAMERLYRRLGDRYGGEPFADLRARFEAITHTDRRHLYSEQGVHWRVPFGEMYELEREEESWLRCAEAERFVLGEALALTLERAADCDRRAVALIEEARRKYEEATAGQERKHREFLEDARRFMEKKLAAAPPPPMPVVAPPAATTVHGRPADTPTVANAPDRRPPAPPQPSIFLPAPPTASRRGRRPRRR